MIVRELTTLAEFEALYGVFDAIWRPDPTNPPVTVELMRAFSHSGNYVAGAFVEGRLAGGSVGFCAPPREASLHSHVTGVVAPGAGLALKRHQRSWALDRGISTITWTFDPLVRRNAYFNLVKLGARPERYYENFYGAMGDEVNAGDESDRALAVWRLADPGPADEGLEAAVAVADGPVVNEVSSPVVLIRLPEDIERLRRDDPVLAKRWRMAVREELGGRLQNGWRVTGFRDGGYVLRSPSAR
ncbi:GNAT family N-acetyltransferase [Herbidospora galbida]|uniref:GNAT family N-acetyltransferase n=1 Tax=Herbidospora galbida TaxID=2575442 RepID=A0A4U3M9D8_9ACTN|nr:GNAT family N-acetyltransferase [Herbidospora galbida]TKK85615.1 GNAT family N-acetyltransferase [Herbidospora galbida]